MASPKRKPQKSPLVEIGLGVAWLLGIAAAVRIVEALLWRSVIGVAIGGAVLVELGASWAGAFLREPDAVAMSISLRALAEAGLT